MTDCLDDHNPSSLLDGVKTPLQLAAARGNLSMVKILTVKSALEDPRNTIRGETPIDLARIKNHPEVMEFLLTQKLT